MMKSILPAQGIAVPLYVGSRFAYESVVIQINIFTFSDPKCRSIWLSAVRLNND